MSKSTVTCTRDVKTQFEKFLNESSEKFITRLMNEDDEDTTEEHLRELLTEVFNTKAFKISRGGGKTRRTKSDGPKAPSNAYIQWSNAEGRSISKKELEKPHLKKLKKMSDAELAEEYDGETDVTKIMKKLVTSKEIISNAAKIWKGHKEAEDETYTKFQEIYEEQRAAFQKLKAEAKESASGDEDDEGAAAAAAPKTKGKGKGKGKSKSKAKPQVDSTDDEEQVEVKTYSLSDFEEFDGLSINLGMTVRGGTNTKFGKKTFGSLDEAVEAMNEDPTTEAIHLDKNGKYTLRTTVNMSKAKSNAAPCVTWIKEGDDESDTG